MLLIWNMYQNLSVGKTHNDIESVDIVSFLYMVNCSSQVPGVCFSNYSCWIIFFFTPIKKEVLFERAWFMPSHWAHTLVSQSEEVIATNSCLSSLSLRDFFLLPSPPASDGLLSLMSPLSPEINCLPAEQVTTTSDVIIFTAIDHTFGEKSQ